MLDLCLWRYSGRAQHRLVAAPVQCHNGSADPGDEIATEEPKHTDTPLGTVRADPLYATVPSGLLMPDSLAPPASQRASLTLQPPQSLIGVALIPRVASMPFASDGLFGGETPFATSSADLGWNIDDVDGVPNGLPNLVRILFGPDAAPPSDLPPPTPAPSMRAQTPESSIQADFERADVFALPEFKEDLDECDDWDEQDDESESEVPARQADLHTDGAPKDWQAQLDSLAHQRWIFAGIALIVGAAAGALLI